MRAFRRMLSLGYSYFFWTSRHTVHLMNAGALALLSELGKQLDANVCPRVTNGGLVVLNKTHVPSTLSTETKHGTEETRRSAAGSRSGSTGQQGTSGGPRPPGDAASV